MVRLHDWTPLLSFLFRHTGISGFFGIFFAHIFSVGYVAHMGSHLLSIR